MDKSICIVGGCGHVGLPLGIAFAEAGARVTLLDIDEAKVREVNAGRMPFIERGADEVLAAILADGRLDATADQGAISQSDAVIVTIGTPIDEYMDPSVRSFDRSIDRVLDRMRDGQLLVLRSTVFPGVTDRLARRVAERALKIDVSHCPERIAQGYAIEELGSLPQAVGGTSTASARRSAALFAMLGVECVDLPAVEAELTKLFCNAYRYINFAISNQFYLIAERHGADFARVRHAMTHRYPRMSGFAGAGFAGGPCLLKDTMQLASFNHNGFVLGQAAMMINEGMPAALVAEAKKRMDLTDATAAILGMAFKGNNDDPRDSLAYKLRKVLAPECRRVLCTDPYIKDSSFVTLDEALREADIVFLGAMHREYRDLAIDKPVIDLFRFLQNADAAEARRSAA